MHMWKGFIIFEAIKLMIAMNGGIFIYLLFLLGILIGGTYLLLRAMRFLENKTYGHFHRIEQKKSERKE